MTYISDAKLQGLSDVDRSCLLANSIAVGYHPKLGDSFVISNIARQAGMYIIGKQSLGKSGLLQKIAIQDAMQNRSLILIDAHGDTVDYCIAQLPEHLVARSRVFDMTDEEHPFGLNVFALPRGSTAIALAQAINRVQHIFEAQWPEVLTQQNFLRYLRASIITLFANPGSTLVDMQRLLTDDSFRQHLLTNMTDQTVQAFWRTQYDELSVAARLSRVEPLIGRLENLFMGRSLVRNIVGQQTTIDFRKAIFNAELLFFKVPFKTLGQDAALIGKLLTGHIHNTVFSFADLPEQQRPRYSLIVDEFAHFAIPDFNELFSGGRAFGASVTVAHQYRDQLPEYLKASTMTAHTIVCFGLAPADAREMAHVFPDSNAVVRSEDINPHPVQHLLAYGSDNPQVQHFVNDYLRPLQRQIKGGSVEITAPGVRLESSVYSFLHVPLKNMPPIRVDNPIPYLDHLLYQVMKAGQDDLLIPCQVVYGFSNIGKGFFPTFRYSLRKRSLLSADVRFPPYLVVEGAYGNRYWTRRVESRQEQLYHFLYHLRETMRHLAQEPIGRRSTLAVSDVAGMLTQLPPRAAFVKSGSDIGVIYTEDTAPAVQGQALAERQSRIQTQTRRQYCTPKAQVEGQASPEPPDEPGLSRWEEV
jgi:hypothetical protein